MTSLLAAMFLVFVAELGDKTQLVALGFGARHRLAPVILGVVLAYAATNLVSVIIGGLLGAALPTRAIGIGGGVLFLGFAVWGLRDDANEVDHVADRPQSRRVVLSVALAMFVAEIGDKTMLATATLAAKGDPILIWIGATIGITMSGMIGVLIGRTVGNRLPERATRIGSSIMFAGFGLALIVLSW